MAVTLAQMYGGKPAASKTLDDFLMEASLNPGVAVQATKERKDSTKKPRAKDLLEEQEPTGYGVQAMPEVNPSLVSRLGSTVGGGLAAAGNILDLPGSSVRDVLALKNPFDQWFTPTSPDNRTTGRDLLRQYGAAGEDDTWGNFGAGMALELALDPLTYTGFGALTKAGQVASKATVKTAQGAEKTLLKTSKEAAKTLADRAAKKQGNVMTRELSTMGARMRMTPRQLILGRGSAAEQLAAEKAFYAAGGTADMLDKPIQSLVSFRIPGLMKEAKELTPKDPQASFDEFVDQNSVKDTSGPPPGPTGPAPGSPPPPPTNPPAPPGPATPPPSPPPSVPPSVPPAGPLPTPPTTPPAGPAQIPPSAPPAAPPTAPPPVAPPAGPLGPAPKSPFEGSLTVGARIKATTTAITEAGSKNSKPKDIDLEIESITQTDDGAWIARFKGKPGSWRGEVSGNGGIKFINASSKRAFEVYGVEPPAGAIPTAVVPPASPASGFRQYLTKGGKNTEVKIDVKKTDAAFDAISPKHANYNMRMKAFRSAGLLRDADVAMVQTALADSDMRFIPENFSFEALEASNTALGQAGVYLKRGSDSTDWATKGTGIADDGYSLALNRKLTSANTPPALVVLHETGHLAFYKMFNQDNELFRRAFESINQMFKDGSARKLLGDVTPDKYERYAQYFASTPHEVMAQMFANNAAKRLPKETPESVRQVFQMAWDQIKEWIDKFTVGITGKSDPRYQSVVDLMEYAGGYIPTSERERILKQLSGSTPPASALPPVSPITPLTKPAKVDINTSIKAYNVLTKARASGDGAAIDDAMNKFLQAAGLPLNRVHNPNEASLLNKVFEDYDAILKFVQVGKAGAPMDEKFLKGLQAQLKTSYGNYWDTILANDKNAAAKKGGPASASSKTPDFESVTGGMPNIDSGKVLYHGTHHDFDQFDRMAGYKYTNNKPKGSTDTLGIWFTDNAENAANLYGPKVYAVPNEFVKPFVIHEAEKGEAWKKLKKLQDRMGGVEGLRDWLLKNKYDSVVMPDVRIDGKTQTVTVALNPESIKISGVTDFDKLGKVTNEFPDLGKALSSTVAGAKALANSAAQIKTQWVSALPKDIAISVGDAIDKGEDLFFKIPGAAEAVAIFKPSVMGALTGKGRDIGEKRYDAVQGSIAAYREAILPLLKSINKEGVMDENLLVAAGKSKEDAIKILNSRNNEMLNFIELGQPLSKELQAVEPALTQVRKLLDDAYQFERDAGLDVKYLDDLFTAYFPRNKRNPAKTMSFNQTIGGVMDTLFSGLKDRRYRDMPGGTAVLNEMSIDPNIASVVTRDPVIRNKVQKGDLESLRAYVASTYGDRLNHNYDPATFDPATDTMFDKIIQDFATMDKYYVETQTPMFGRNILQDLSKRLEDGKRSAFTAMAAQELIGKNLKPISIPQKAFKNQKDVAAAAGDPVPLIPKEQVYEGNKSIADMMLKAPKAWDNVIDHMDKKQIASRDAMIAQNADNLMVELMNGKPATQFMDGQMVKVGIDANGKLTVTRKEMQRGSSSPVEVTDIMDFNDENLQKIVRQQTNREFLSGFGVEKDLMDEAGRWMKPFSEPEVVGNISTAMRRFMNVWRTGQTALWPAFHFRNLLSGQVQNVMFGAKDTTQKAGYMQYFKPLQDAYKLERGETIDDLTSLPGYKGLTPEQATEKFKDEIFILGGIGDKMGYASEYIGDSASTLATQYPGMAPHFQPAPAGTTKWDQWNPLAVKDSVSVGPGGVTHYNDDLSGWARAGRGASNAIEFYNRVTPYIAFRRQGFSPKAAMDKVNKIQVDYSSLSAVERKIRNWVPFYCVPVDHEILTRDGWKTHDQLKLGEDVLAYDTEADKTYWKPLLDIAEFDFDGELMQYESSRKGKKINFQFTKDHRWPIELPVKEQAVSFDGGVATIKRQQIGFERSIVRAHSIPKNATLIGAAPLGEDCESCLSDRLAAILGWVVTDGYFRWRGNYCEMLVYQSPKKHLNEIIELLGTSPRQPHPVSGVVAVPVALKDMKEIVKQFKCKQDLVGIVTRLSKSAAAAMLDAMDKAESSSTASNLNFAQDPAYNPDVLEAYQILRMLNGQVANISQKGAYVRKRTRYSWTSKAISSVHYKGKIWCPKTELGTWVMRHNGNVVITGNTFSSRQLPVVLEELAKNPGGPMAMTIKVTNRGRDRDANIPDHIASTAAIPFGTKSDGSNSYLTGFGLAFEDALNLANGPLRGNIPETLREVASRSNPLVKTGIETMFGRSLFFDGPGGGKELQELDPTLGRTRDNIKQILTGETTTSKSEPLMGSNALEQVVANSPFARAATTARTLTDARKWERPDHLLMNLSTGMRVSDVSPAAQDAVYRDRLAQSIKDMGGRTYTRPYISDIAEAKMSPEQLAEAQGMLNELKVIDKRFKARREADEMQKGNSKIRDALNN